MKFLQALLIACSISLAGNAQIVAVNPTAEGGFESGATFVSNGWTAVNPTTYANQWTLTNNAPAFSGSAGAHVTNDTVTFAYNTTVSRTCHLFRNFTIPTGASSINLSFQWKGFGQSGADRLLVYLAPTSVLPIANMPASPSTTMAGATLIWTQPTYAENSYIPASISLPSGLAGSTVRLIFTWQNDASGGVSPGAAIDNISVTYDCATPAAISGVNTICAGTTTSYNTTSTGGSWSSSNASVATVSATGVVTGVAAGSATITYTSSCSAYVIKTVNVLAAIPAITGNAPICTGYNVTLGNPLAGGVWSSAVPGIATVSTTGFVTGASSGTTAISYTVGLCSAIAVVTVNALPDTITGDDTLCVGGTTTFANVVLGGSWSSSFVTVASVLPASGLISGIIPGVSYVTYTMPGGCFATRQVTVVDLPAPITGPTDLCPGTQINLASATSGGTWTSLNPGAASVNPITGRVTGISSDVVTIVYTSRFGCQVSTMIYVNPVPANIVGANILCAGTTETYYNTTPGGAWTSMSPGTATIGATTGILNGVNGGTVVVRYTLSTGCFTSKTVTVTPAPSPVISFNNVTNTLETSLGFLTYQWYHSVYGMLTGATIYKVAGVYNGNYTVRVTDGSGCVGTSAPFNYYTFLSVADNVGKMNVAIFPNPANNIVHISALSKVNIAISGIDGKVYMEQSGVNEVDITELNAGLYLLTVYDNDGQKLTTVKLVKM